MFYKKHSLSDFSKAKYYLSFIFQHFNYNQEINYICLMVQKNYLNNLTCLPYNTSSIADMLRNFLKKALSTQSKNIQMFSTSSGGKKLDGKVAVVTASTDGIGFAIAKNLAENGASVVVSSRKEKNVSAAVKQLQDSGLTKITGVVCHVGKAEDRSNLFKEASKIYGGVDILVSNAAANPEAGPVLDCDEKVWDKIFEINVKAGYLLAKEALPYLRKRGGGSIVFVSSIAGFQPFKLLGAYSVSKTALLGLTKTASQDLAPENIRVNCVAPGIVETKFSAAITTGPAREAALQMIPMNRLAKPDEIGGIVTFLCSSDASYITGETIVVAGGMQSRL